MFPPISFTTWPLNSNLRLWYYIVFGGHWLFINPLVQHSKLNTRTFRQLVFVFCLVVPFFPPTWSISFMQINIKIEKLKSWWQLKWKRCKNYIIRPLSSTFGVMFYLCPSLPVHPLSILKKSFHSRMHWFYFFSHKQSQTLNSHLPSDISKDPSTGSNGPCSWSD